MEALIKFRTRREVLPGPFNTPPNFSLYQSRRDEIFVEHIAPNQFSSPFMGGRSGMSLLKELWVPAFSAATNISSLRDCGSTLRGSLNKGYHYHLIRASYSHRSVKQTDYSAELERELKVICKLLAFFVMTFSQALC